MGYRSDVVIVISEKIRTELLLGKLTLPRAFEVNGVIPEEYTVRRYHSDIDTAKNDKCLFFKIDGWKWYSNYPEIQEIHKFLDSLDEDEFGFLRVGEEIGDVEILGEPGEFDVYAYQSISYPGG